jgi:hypothetical protein
MWVTRMRRGRKGREIVGKRILKKGERKIDCEQTVRRENSEKEEEEEGKG